MKAEDKFYFGKPGQPEQFAKQVISTRGNKRAEISGPDGSGQWRAYVIQKSPTGLPSEPYHEDLLGDMKFFDTEEKARRAASKMLASRPGQPERFANAAWMPEVNRMLSDLRRERAKIKIWISGSDSVTAAGSSIGTSGRWMGTTWIVAGRIANYLKFGVPGAALKHEEKSNYPKKGMTTSFYTVSNLPKELIAYLKNWGISTTPQSFSGFTGTSAVAYARPGQPEKFDASSLDRGSFAEASTSPMLGKLLASKMMPEGGWRAVQAGSDTLVISFEDADLARDFGRRVATKGYNATSPVQAIGRYWNVEVKNGK
jgi:hypothetical protein